MVGTALVIQFGIWWAVSVIVGTNMCFDGVVYSIGYRSWDMECSESNIG